MTVYTDEVVCAPRAGTLYDVMELILDRGMVIDVFVRVSLVGIEILKIDARIVVASVDTYLRFAEACNRLDLEHDSRSKTVPELFGGGPVSKTIGKAGAKRTARSLADKVKDVLTPDDDTDDDEGSERAAQPERRRRSPAKKTSSSSSRRGSDDDRPRTRRRKAEEEE
ncbi:MULTISPECIES: gas vesicle structural protein GvpA [unclassified Streptomyces]|uniref:gas vesicle structural protein GvpA n=2 Tax=Streptomyces TaxID=1883 RepID=UPI00363F4479